MSPRKVVEAQKITNKISNFFLKRGNARVANAINSASNEVLCFENGSHRKRKYDRGLNAKICEALMCLFYEKKAKEQYVRTVTKLIETYRASHGLPTDEFIVDGGYVDEDIHEEMLNPDETFTDVAAKQYKELTKPAPTDDVEAVSVAEEPFEVQGDTCSGDSCDMTQHIIDNTSVGNRYSVNSIVNEIVNGRGGDSIEIDGEVLDAFKQLVMNGFFEVIQREPYNGRISVVQRVK